MFYSSYKNAHRAAYLEWLEVGYMPKIVEAKPGRFVLVTA